MHLRLDKILYKKMKLTRTKISPEPHRKTKRDWTLSKSRCLSMMAFKNELLQYSQF